MLKREDYKAIKRMDKQQMEEYLTKVYQRGYDAGIKSMTASKRESVPEEKVQAGE